MTALTTSPPRPVRTYSALLTALVLCWVAAFAPRAMAQTFDRGHVDVFYVTSHGGELSLSMKEDITGGGVQRPGDDVVLHVSDAAWSEATAGVDGIGQATYFLPQSQNHDVIWPGWDTQPIAADGYQAVDFNFQDVSGPGEVYIFETEGFGGIKSVTNDGSYNLRTGSVINQPYPAHKHINWAFTHPGTYQMTVYASADGQSSNAVTYTWQVGGEAGDAPAPAAPSGGGAAQGGGGHAGAGAGQPGHTGNHGGAPAPQGGGHAAPGPRAGGARPGPAPAPAPAAPSGGGSSSSNSGGGNAQCTPGLQPHIKDDTTSPAQWRPAQGATFYLSSNAEVNLPSNVGTVPEGKAWMIGATQVAGVPWLGANTQHQTMHEHLASSVRWDITGFSGPGPMTVYSQGQLGQIVGEEWFRAAGGGFQGSKAIPRNTHVHPNWVFGAPGNYQVNITQSAQLSNGKKVSGSATLNFVVGGNNPGGAFSDGHFDLGAIVNPEGGECAATGVAGGAGAGAAGGANADLAAAEGLSEEELAAQGLAADGTPLAAGAFGTGFGGQNSKLFNIAAIVLGLGLLFLGIAAAHYAVKKAKSAEDTDEPGDGPGGPGSDGSQPPQPPQPPQAPQTAMIPQV
ncbi:TIGR03773 family transporter-associated surface protein [Corynebacterium propinquum]